MKTEEQKAYEQVIEELKDREKHLRAIVNTATDAIVTINGENRVVFWNAAAEKMLGYTKDEIIGRNLGDIIPSGQYQPSQEELLTGLTGDEEIFAGSRTESIAFRKDGKELPIELSLAVWKSKKGIFLTGIIRDISKRKEKDKLIRKMAFYDPLTALANRALFKDYLQQMVFAAERNNQMLALFFLDLDGFKLVNDTLGHTTGDKLLKAVGERLRKAIRRADVIARMGGDEFAIIMQISSAEDVINVAEKVLNAFNKFFKINGNRIFSTTSIGISIFPSDTRVPETLISDADAAMYRAKEAGKNNYQFFTQALQEKISKRAAFENSIRNAIENEEFELYYQPEVDLRTGRVLAAEALLRWPPLHKNEMLPELIEIAELAGLMTPLGNWVLRNACTQAKRWQDLGFRPISIASNSSSHQLLQAGFVKDIKDILKKLNLDPILLEVEITEGGIIEKTDITAKALYELNALGVKIVLDDFGTQHSSLASLKFFPINKIKIAKEFIDNIYRPSSFDSAIVRSIISAAHSLNIDIVAEGVEKKEQVKALKDLGCDSIQGFYFSPPLPAKDFEMLLRENRYLDMRKIA